MLLIFFVYPPVKTSERVVISKEDCYIKDTLFEECQSSAGGAIYADSLDCAVTVNYSYFKHCRATSSVVWNSRTVGGGAIIAHCKSLYLWMVCFFHCQSNEGVRGTNVYLWTPASSNCSTKFVSQVVENGHDDIFCDYCTQAIQNCNSTGEATDGSILIGSQSVGTHMSYCNFHDSVVYRSVGFSNGDMDTNVLEKTNFINITAIDGIIEVLWNRMLCNDCIFNRCTGEHVSSSRNGVVLFNNSFIDGNPYTFSTVFYHCVNPSRQFTAFRATNTITVLLLLFHFVLL